MKKSVIKRQIEGITTQQKGEEEKRTSKKNAVQK
jgi:hypothetical protein